MSDPGQDVPAEDQAEMNARFQLAELEHRVGIAVLLALLAEAGVVALAILYAISRRRDDA